MSNIADMKADVSAHLCILHTIIMFLVSSAPQAQFILIDVPFNEGRVLQISKK
jgi:hypothetical protein